MGRSGSRRGDPAGRLWREKTAEERSRGAQSAEPFVRRAAQGNAADESYTSAGVRGQGADLAGSKGTDTERESARRWRLRAGDRRAVRARSKGRYNPRQPPGDDAATAQDGPHTRGRRQNKCGRNPPETSESQCGYARGASAGLAEMRQAGTELHGPGAAAAWESGSALFFGFFVDGGAGCGAAGESAGDTADRWREPGPD